MAGEFLNHQIHRRLTLFERKSALRVPSPPHPRAGLHYMRCAIAWPATISALAE